LTTIDIITTEQYLLEISLSVANFNFLTLAVLQEYQVGINNW